MPSFDETIARMKGLYTYGKEINESNDLRTHTLEYHAIAADGKSYGIIRECNKYYIKTAPKDKEMVAEAYDYIGGFCNKGSYEYKSYANAMKNFEMKMSSINETCEGEIKMNNLDQFKSRDVMVEGTKKMQDEIARCRQIMYNTSMIMNESFNPVKDGENNNSQPEAETGEKGDKFGGKGAKNAKANPTYPGSKTKGLKEKSAPFEENPIAEGKCCEKCGKEKCCCGSCNEEAGDIGDNPLMPNTRNWAGPKMGAKEPDQIGWDMDGQEKVNEETNEWDEGLPGSAGIGEPDTDHNNNPFNKSINESDNDFGGEDEEGFDLEPGAEDEGGEFGNEGDEFGDEGDEFGDEGDEFGNEGDEFGDEGDEFGDEGDEFGDEGDEFGDEGDEFGDEGDEFGDEESTDEPSEDEDLRSEIESLKAEIEALKSQIEGEDTDSFDSTEDGEDFSTEGDEFGDEGDEFGNEGDEFGDEGDEFGDEGGEFGDEGDEFGDEGDEFGDEGDEFGDEGDEFGDEEQNELNEAKLNRIIDSVIKKVMNEGRSKRNRSRMNEDELHVFGKHPGYRKKPMELPTTGSDKNQWGRDWNDDSVHNEEPFGKQIGNGDPFTQLVNAVTKDVMYQLKKGIPIEGMNKKKVD